MSFPLSVFIFGSTNNVPGRNESIP
ncbi:MAG: hypothetical protein KBC24_02275 [Caldisericia bacterium]|nr:hypothetical protein [Caldisericia bacterium]MBP6928381.1 hypothetical protein [Caldisericia bacterium]NMD15128.1 hypothetical protein [Caldisericales bacterium]